MTLHHGDIVAGRFTIGRAAGSGGMGTVYQARDQLSGELVALKLLNASASEGGDNERFAREAQILAELKHPGIVSYVAHGQTAQGLRFLAMQWLEGEDLAARLARAALPLQDALLLMQAVAEALAFAHSRGILHRDLKPTNLFLPAGDISRVQILDFGIARKLSTSRAMTRTGMIVGTPEYMAPEQARGARELTPAADLFSLGCVLYECLVGEPPFVGEHIAAVLVRILFEEPTPVAQRRLGLPEPVCELVARLLAKEPAQRLGSASELAAALRTIGTLGDLPLSATLPAPARSKPAKSDTEQVLLSLVLALPPSGTEPDKLTMPASLEVYEQQRHGHLLAKLQALGVQADLLIGGALVVTVPQMSSAQDQAAQAAHCAALVKEGWPEAQVAVVTGRGSRSRGGLTGEVLDRAWRLLGLKDPASAAFSGSSMQIRIDHVSAGLLEARFDIEPLPDTAEGFALGSERLDPDAGRLLLGKPTPCLGRERELGTLEAAYNECKEEQVARAVLVLGSPGLGKSRLRHEFVRRIRSRGAQGIVLVGRGEPMKAKSAYGIIGDLLRREWDLQEGQDLTEQRASIRASIAAEIPASEALRVTMFLGEVCGVPFPDEESPQLRAARQDPRIMSDQVERAWLDGVQLFSSAEPVLMILEDLHWSDALTVKLVEMTLRRLRDRAFMVLALARPEINELYPNLWAGVVQELPLHPLPRKAGERLVRQILGPEVPSTEVTQLVEQSAGNPLFLEELIRASADRKPGRLPETIVAMIQARIGRLPAGSRRALRAASVFGEIFWENGVQHLLAATHGEERIHSTLDELMREEIIEKVPEGRFTHESQYHFRHALVRDAAYGLVSDEEKVAWHSAAGTFLESAGERDAAVLAEHFQCGGAHARAVEYYIHAADQAAANNDQASTLLRAERGIACGATGEARGILRSLQATVYTWQDEWEAAYSSGNEALALLPPGSSRWCKLMTAMFVVTSGTQKFERFNSLVAEFSKIPPALGARVAYLEAAGWLGIMFTGIGQREPARAFLGLIDSISSTLDVQDVASWLQVKMSQSFYQRLLESDPWLNLVRAQEGTSYAEQIRDLRNLAFLSPLVGLAQSELGDFEQGEKTLRFAVELAQRIRENLVLSQAKIYLASLLLSQPGERRIEEATVLVREVLNTQQVNPFLIGLGHETLAHALMLSGELQQAHAEAQIATEILSFSPTLRLQALALWIQILLLQEHIAEARDLAHQGLSQLGLMGGAGCTEVKFRLAAAEALHAGSDAIGAQSALRDAIEQVNLRANKIPDLALRESFLSRVPENVRLLELARKWGT